MDRRDFFKACAAVAAGASGLAPLLAGCSRAKTIAAPILSGHVPGITRQDGATFLMENHNVAHLIWHALDVRHATVVHVDAHDDFRLVPPDKLEAIAGLLQQNAYKALFLKSDLSSSFEFKIRPADQLFDLGNFLFPCLEDGTLSSLYWVVPQKRLDPADVDRLALHFHHVLQLSTFPGVRSPANNRAELTLGARRLTVCTLDALPTLPPGALLDLDVDFFAFPRALVDDHLPGALIHEPAQVCRTLLNRVPAPRVTTVCSSVWGGYLPVIFRFLADACFDALVSGRYPAHARSLLEEVIAMRTMSRLARLPAGARDPRYSPHLDYLAGLLQLTQGKGEDGLDRIEAAARNLPVYQKGLLDMAEAFLYMGIPARAEEAIARFERVAGLPTTGSKAWRARVLLARSKPVEAEAVARTLVDWDRQPYPLMLLGGTLTEQGRVEEAAGIYAEVIRMDPGNGAAYYNLGVAFDRQGRLDEAAEHYGKALILKPLFADAHENMGYVRLRQQKLDDAIRHFTETVRISPLRVKAWSNLGRAHGMKTQHARAVECYHRALALNPALPDVQFFLAVELLASGRPDDAIPPCREALRLRPDWPEAADLLRALTGPR